MSIDLDYLDSDDIKRRVRLPSRDVEPSEGIPLSLDVDRIPAYQACPLAFRKRLVDELWARGLVEPKDFIGLDKAEKIRAALLSTVKADTMTIITFAQENTSNG